MSSGGRLVGLAVAVAVARRRAPSPSGTGRSRRGSRSGGRGRRRRRGSCCDRSGARPGPRRRRAPGWGARPRRPGASSPRAPSCRAGRAARRGSAAPGPRPPPLRLPRDRAGILEGGPRVSPRGGGTRRGASGQLLAPAASPPSCAPLTTARTGTGWKDSSWKVPPVDQRGRGLAQPDRVQRLHDPALGARALGQEDVGSPVEQHQHRHVRGGCRRTPPAGAPGTRPCPPCSPSGGRR